MYESFFQFKERPFAAAPRVDRYYPSGSAEAARLAVARCVERAEGFAVVLGASGIGKTLFCQVLAEQFRARLAPVHLAGGQIASRKGLLQAILFELGLPFKRREEGELRLALLDRITTGRDKTEGLLLIVDEAQSLRARLFEELRLLSNVSRQGKASIRIVLAGTPSLEERLAHPKLTPFQQRVTVRCTLHPFAGAETQEYVRAQTAVVGGDPDVIWSTDSLLAIHAHSDGIPRLINQVCDHALLLAAADGVKHVDIRRIEEAWADMQQLPLPADGSSAGKPLPGLGEPEAVIEFGPLDDGLTMSPVAAGDGPEDPPPGPLEADGHGKITNENWPEPSIAYSANELHQHGGSVPNERETATHLEDAESPELHVSVYDDFPIIVGHCGKSASADPDVAWPGDDGLTDDGVDRRPIQPHAPCTTERRSSIAVDPVLPESSAIDASALRVANDVDGAAVEEVVPLPTYDPALLPGWPAARVAPTRPIPIRPAKPSSPPPRERQFSQLFTRLRQGRQGG